jgi:hypothetical protein
MQAAALLQQTFTTVQDQGKATANEQHTPTKTHESTGKDKVKVESIKQLSKPTSYEKPQSSWQPKEVQGNDKVSYYWRCYTKGHVVTECIMTMYYPICDCNDHAKERCPKWRSEKPIVATCSYAVEGLGLFQIPHATAQQQKNDSQTAIIQVTNGALIIPNVISKLEMLIPTKWS